MLDASTVAALNKATGGSVDANAVSGPLSSRIAQINSIAKNAGSAAPQTAPPSAMDEMFGNAPATGILTGLVKNTIGSGGIGGLIAKPTTAAVTAPAQGNVAQSKDQLTQVTTALIQKISSLPTDDPRRAALSSIVQENLKAMGIADNTMTSLNDAQETQAENAGTALNAASTLAAGAGTGEAIANQGVKTIGQQIAHGAITGAEVGAAQGAGTSMQDPNATIGSVAKDTVEGGVTGAATGGILEGALGAIGKGVTALSERSSNASTKAVQDSIAAVDPDLSGKRLAASYEKGALNGTLSKGGIISKTTAGISPDIQKLGTSLADLHLDPSDPVGNLQKLGGDMKTTEAKITPYNNYPVSQGVKTVLTNQLEDLKTTAPKEFSGIKESQSMFENVINFGKEIVANSKDTIGGYRTARTAFDNQAKLEFPSAFDEKGFVNLKTPAGQAIRAVRDTLNSNLYEIAPKNSNIEGLIAREANLYRAIRNIAPSAAKIDGMNAVQRVVATVRKNPVVSVATAYGADKVLKATTGIGIPGL